MLSSVTVLGGLALFVVVWGIPALVIDRRISRRQRLSLLERLQSGHPVRAADEAQRWLDEQRG
jgi:hypothetical protein